MGKVKNVVKWFSVSILILSFLSLFGFGAIYINSGGQNGTVTWLFKKFVTFPGIAYHVLTSSEIRGIPPTYVKKDTSFVEINKLKYNLYGLNSYYDRDHSQWGIRLFNFKNESIIHTWHLKKESFEFGSGKRQFRSAAPRNSILLPNRGLIVDCDETTNIYKIDKDSKIIWHNTSKIYHHSLNLADDGNIWVCSRAVKGFEANRTGGIISYNDDFVTKLSVETGQILFDKSVSEILIENGYENFVFGFSNFKYPKQGTDPIHLNDIQPVPGDSKYWKKGDLFLSLRHRSLIILYRPESNRIIQLIYGSFLNQHDVDVISENEISVFNNNYTMIGSDGVDGLISKADKTFMKLLSSDIVIYNFEDSVFRESNKDKFLTEKIYTFSQGFQQLLPNGDTYVEDQNNGKIYIMNDKEILYKKQIPTSLDYMVERPHWIRIYQHINF